MQQLTQFLELSWRQPHDRSELELGGTAPDALLTCSDREQMGSYFLGQNRQLRSPPDPHGLDDNFDFVKALLTCPGTSGFLT